MAWRWLTRMRTALYLLGVLALLTVVATAVPQEPNVPSTVGRWLAGEEGPGAGVARVLDAFGAFDVYGSAAFLALTMLLFISLTACLIPRIKAWIRLVRTSKPPLVRHLGGQDAVATFVTDRSPDEAHAVANQILVGRRWRVRAHDGDPAEERTPKPPQVAGEKGLWSREGGSLVFHLSFYVLLGAVVLGQLLTFEGQRGIVEGEDGFRDTAVSYWSYNPGRWFDESDHAGWRIDLDAFNVDWVRDPLAAGAGQPTEFRSEITVTPAEGEPYEAVIDSNRPAMIDGMRVTQLDWGYAPRVVVEVDGEVVHDAFVNATASDAGFFSGAVKAPAADPDVGLELFFYPFAPDGDDGRPVPTGAPWDEAPMLLFRQYRGDLQLGATQQTVNTLDTSGLESEGGAYLRLGQTVEVGDATISYPEHRRWVGYQVSSRPQIPALLAGSGLLVAGLIPALYAYRRRLWVLAARDEATGHTLVTVAGRSFQRPEAFEVEHAEIVAELMAAAGGSHDDTAEPPDRSDGSGYPAATDGRPTADDGDHRRNDDPTEAQTIRDRRTDVLPAPARSGADPEVVRR
jgi:cytochrome c biogenesis protein